MAWTTMPTFTAGSVLTAAQLAILVANLNETAPAKATAPTGGARIFASAGTNSIAQRVIASDSVGPGEATSTLNTWVNLGTFGPQCIVTTGAYAMVFVNSTLTNTSATARTQSSYLVSGSTNVAVQAGFGVYHDQNSSDLSEDTRYSSTTLQSGLTSGSNTFTQQYYTTAGTGTFGNRTLIVMGL